MTEINTQIENNKNIDYDSKEKIVEVKNLNISFNTYAGEVKAVRGVNFDIYKGDCRRVRMWKDCSK